MDVDRRGLIRAGGVIAGLPLVPFVGQAATVPPRIAALIAAMTIEEKAGQLSCYADAVRPVDAVFNPVVNPATAQAQLAEIRAGRIGMIFNGTGVAGARQAQAAALASRLRIPLVLAADVLHGHTTIFPIPLAEAAAFDPALAERSARMQAVEASAAGLHWTFAPMVDVARDQRWGRVAEGAGEDPYLGALYAAARVRGFQGANLRRDDALAACPKHFIGYGAVIGGMEYGATDMTAATMAEVHLPPFRAAFAAGGASTMTSFSAVDGVPVTANRALLTGLLRDAMGFEGPVVTDYDADRELIAHGFAEDEADAAAKAMLAGADISMQSGLYIRHLPGLVAGGRVPMARVDEAVARVLALKERLGLFERPYRSMEVATERRVVGSAAIRAAAREAAVRSIVMLRNDGDLLPLRAGVRVALIGPTGADRAQLNGPWSFAGRAGDSIDLATALAARRDVAVEVVKGCAIDAAIPGGIEAAVAAAARADVVLLAVGEGGGMSGEGNSRVDIAIPAPQRALAEAVASAGKPVVVLLSHGRALALEGAIADAPAILGCWFLGSEAGPAIAAILMGAREPTGRLPVSFPRATGQQPWSYDRPSVGRPLLPPPAEQGGRAGWRDAADRPLYGFGHGLGYARFRLGALTVPAEVGPGAAVPVSVEVENVSDRAGETVVQLYLRDAVASRTRPRRLLKGFARVALAGGARRRVDFTLPAEALAFAGADGVWVTEPGRFRVWAAFSSGDEGMVGVFALTR